MHLSGVLLVRVALLLSNVGIASVYAVPTGPILEADGWTPVRSSQVVSIPKEFDERQNENLLQPENEYRTELQTHDTDNKGFQLEWQAVPLPTHPEESVNYVETNNNNIIIDLPSGDAKAHKIPVTEDILEYNTNALQGEEQLLSIDSEQYVSAEDYEIQRQQSYSGFGERIQQNNVEQTNFAEGQDFQVDTKSEKPPVIIYPEGSVHYQPPPRDNDHQREDHEHVLVQTASIVHPSAVQKQHLSPVHQQGRFPPVPPPRTPILRPHPPNRPPPHHPQQQPRPFPRRPGPPKRFSNIPGGGAPHRPLENGRPPALPPVRRPQQEALPRSSVVGTNDQFISTPAKGSFQNGKQPPPQIPQEARHAASIPPQELSNLSEVPDRNPPRQPSPGPSRGRPRPRPRPRPRRPKPPSLVDRAKCQVKKVISEGAINDERFMVKQLNCVLNKGPCDETGITLKRLAPEIMRGVCPPPCTPCKEQQIKMIMSKISKRYPQQWNEMIRELQKRN